MNHLTENHLTEEQIAAVLRAPDAGGGLVRRAVAAHLASCEHCAHEVALARALESAVARLPVVEVGANFTARVMAEVTAIGPMRSGARAAARVRTAPTVWALLLGVVLLVLMAVQTPLIPGEVPAVGASSAAARAVEALSGLLSHPAFATTATAIAAILVLIGLDPLFERRMLRPRDRSRS